MDEINRLVEAGAPIPEAIKICLAKRGLSVAAFAKKYGFSAPIASAMLNGRYRPTERGAQALIDELGGTPDEWREMLWQAGKPASAA